MNWLSTHICKNAGLKCIVLGDCGGGAVRYRLRAASGIVFGSGKRTNCVAAADLGWVRGCIQRGHEVARLDRVIARLAKDRVVES